MHKRSLLQLAAALALASAGGGVPAQELVVNEKVNVLAGFGITPSATATAPISTQSKTPQVVMAAVKDPGKNK